MATVQHSALTTANLHEPKGVSTASADQVYVADGLGSGTWTATTAIPIILPVAGYISGEQTITVSSELTLAHSLAAVPRTVQVRVRCNNTGDLGYAVGDEIYMTGELNDTSGSGFTVYADTVNVYIVTGASVKVIHRTTWASSTLTVSRWRYKVEAWI